jgi:hypothetical protein
LIKRKNEATLSYKSNKAESVHLARKVPIELLALDWLNKIDASIETRAYLVEHFLPVLVLGCEKVLKEASKRNLIEENKSDLNYNPKPNEQKNRKITHYDSQYEEQWPETIEKVLLNKRTKTSKIINYEVCFKKVDKVPFAKFKCCPNDSCNDPKNPRIIHRDLNASHNILNKLKRMLNNEDELAAFKR